MPDRPIGTLSLARWRWWDVLRLALALLWLIAAGTAWWAAPRQQSYEQAKADVAAGRVVAYQWGEGWDTRPGAWFSSATLRSSGEFGPVFAWRTADGRVHWTDTYVSGEVIFSDIGDREGFSDPGAAALARDLRSAGLEQRIGDVQSVRRIGTGIAFVLGVVFLAAIVGGPAPVRGTRWYWFWLVYLVPFGLGLLYWLAREQPRSGTAAASLGPLDGGGTRRRHSGFFGFGVGLLAAILISLLTMAMRGFLGPW